LAQQLFLHEKSFKSSGTDDLEEYVTETLVKKGLGIYDATHYEIDRILKQPLLASYIFADMISRRAQIGWSTHGHSAVDVNIYGTAGAEVLRGNHENTEIGEFLRDYLSLDLKKVTKELNQKVGIFKGGSADSSLMDAPSSEEQLYAFEALHHSPV
jgi:alkaline phosphatase